MAARLRKSHQDDVRSKIKTSQLINRLEKHTLRETLSVSQVRAIEILLKKTLPDLQAITLDGEMNHNVNVKGALGWKKPT